MSVAFKSISHFQLPQLLALIKDVNAHTKISIASVRSTVISNSTSIASQPGFVDG